MKLVTTTTKQINKIKINFLTPPNQASKTINSNKFDILGIKLSQKVIHQEVTSPTEFYWIIECNDKEFRQISLRCYAAQKKIKAVFRTLLKWVNRANKVATKFKFNSEKAKRWIIAQARKSFGNDKASLQNMMEELAKAKSTPTEIIHITDKDYIIFWLQQDIIRVIELS